MQFVTFFRLLTAAFVFMTLLSCSKANQEDGKMKRKSSPVQTTETTNTAESTATEQPSNTEDAVADQPEDMTPPPPAPAPVAFAISSSAFQNNGRIPDQYVAKNGNANQSPPLAWAGAPTGTAFFVVQAVDLDTGTPLLHWLITNIPSTSKSLPAAIPAGNNLAAPAEALGASQPKAYSGPNPPSLHRYEFTVYAIKAGQTLNLTPNNVAANKTELEGKSLGRSVIVGTYN